MKSMSRPLVLLVAFSGGLVLADACTSSKANSDHCSLLEGDATCADRYPGEFEFCGGDCVDSENNDGCVDQAPTDLDCWYPCGDDQTAEDDMSCVGTTETETNASTMDSTDTDPSSSLTDDTATTMSSNTQGTETEDAGTTTESGGDCQTSTECTNADFPVCLDNECVACTDTPDGDVACNSKDETMPVCNDVGQCVQCTDANVAACADTTPVCDTGTSTCVGCTYHEQCSDTACDIATGACFEDCVVDVEDGESIEDAVANNCVLIVHAGAFVESVQIDAGATVAILAAEGDAPSVVGQPANGLPSLDISGGSTVYIQGLRVNGNDGGGLGISVDGAALYLDRTEVVTNTGGGVALTGAASAHIRNSYLGGATADVAALSVQGSTADVVYSTLGGYDDGFGGGSALQCSSPMAVSVRNSLVVKSGAGPEIVCDEADITYTCTENAFAGMGNVVLPDLGAMWFVDFNGGNYDLNTPPDEVLTAARWTTGDPSVDISGVDPRPSVDGTMDVAGADVP
jgi:hypothetical protein